MNEALTTRNYDGTFMHVRDGRVETLRIIHRVQDGAVTERLVSLDGSGREFIRRGGELMCYLPDQRTVLVEHPPQGGTLLGSLPQIDDTTAQFYDIRSLERGRLMGRDARVIAVSPRDEFRYGYRLWIDEATAMPLKTQLCDGKGRVIEQVVFASLALPERIADAEFQPAVATEGFRWLRDTSRPAGAAEPDAGGALWSAMRLPPGFRMTTRGSQAMPGSGSPASHLVFSDGVASVSVFVETRPPANGALDGEARMGSSSAFSTTVEGHQVTAVGEVPPETVRFIATQVRPGARRR
jgi:sigma-E factor negative regulatory protein RseB